MILDLRIASTQAKNRLDGQQGRAYNDRRGGLVDETSDFSSFQVTLTLDIVLYHSMVMRPHSSFRFL